MSENKSAKRRLDVGSSEEVEASTKKHVKVVKNPYLKKSSQTTTAKTEEASDSAINTAAHATTITPETGIEKFFVPKRKAGDKKPSHVVRTLVPPRLLQEHGDNVTSSSDEDGDSTSSLYYHSADESSSGKLKKTKVYEPDHIHSSLDYHNRGELALDHGSLNSYRFIRNHFLIPFDIETDPDFGPYSGSCFEERVIRAYSLGQLKPKQTAKNGESLLVCTYCGDEGHKRDGCLKLL